MNSLLTVFFLTILFLQVQAEDEVVCAGTTGVVVYSYSTFSEYATISITSVNGKVPILEVTTPIENEEHTVEYPFCATESLYTFKFTSQVPLPDGSIFYVKLALSNNEYDTVARFTHTLGSPEEHVLDLMWVIPPQDQWYYYMGGIPNDLKTEASVSTWSTASIGSFPASTNQLQIYKHTFPAVGYRGDYLTFTMAIRYQYGCIVYTFRNKEQKEIFRDGIEGDLTASTLATSEYSDVKYKQITLPNHYTYFPTTAYSAYTVIVVLVAKEATQTASVFDFAFRYTKNSYSCLFDYTVDSTISNVANAFDYSYSTAVTSDSCESQSITIQFNNYRRQYASALYLQKALDQTTSFPTQFNVKAKNPGDEEWIALDTKTGISFDRFESRLLVYFNSNNTAFNQFKLEAISTGDSDSCDWSLVEIDLVAQYYKSDSLVISPSYYSFQTGIYYETAIPRYPYFMNFTITPELPTGLHLNTATGVISGIPTIASPKTSYTLKGYVPDGKYSKTTTLSITVTSCNEGEVLFNFLSQVSTYSYTDVYVYAGKDTSGAELTKYTASTSPEQSPVCLSGITTLVATHNPSKNSRKNVALRLQLQLDEHFASSLLLKTTESISKLTTGEVPFRRSLTEWKIYKENMVSSDWYSLEYDASSWTTSKAMSFGKGATTVYIRKEFPISSLTDIHVLNVYAEYSGGFIAYFNGHKVARFSLPEVVESSTLGESISTKKVSFGIILSLNDASETNNVIAFEVHSFTDNLHMINFDATGIYGLDECSTLANSVSEKVMTNMYSYYYTGQMLNFDFYYPNTYSWYGQYTPKPSGEINAYIEYAIDNLENASFNALGVVQSDERVHKDCEVSLNVYDEAINGFTPLVEALNQDLSAYTPHSYYMFDGMTSERKFRFKIPRECAITSSTESLRFSLIQLQYCVTDTCPADGEYPAVFNGQKSTIRCPKGYTGYKSRSCVNGVLEETVEDTCVPVNEMTYDRENTLLILVDDEVSFTPTLRHPVSTFSITGELPEGLSFSTTTGTISGTASEVTNELVFTVTAADENYGVTTEVVLIVLSEEAFAITATATVTNPENEEVKKIESITSTVYDYYVLDKTTEYAIVKVEGATVIPYSGEVWKYKRPAMHIDYYFHEMATSAFRWKTTKEDVYTHYIHTMKKCPENKTFITVQHMLTNEYKQYCVTPNVPVNITTYNEYIQVFGKAGEVLAYTSNRYDCYTNYIIPEYSSIPESEEVINNPLYEGIVFYGSYYGIPQQLFREKFMMTLRYTSASTGIIPIRRPVTFNEKKKSIFDGNQLRPLDTNLEDIDSLEHNKYVTETALTMMEIVYRMKNGESLQLSRTQLKEMIALLCTQDDCTDNWRIVIDVLQKQGVCEEGTESNRNCKRYKMSGFNQESYTNRDSVWIKNEIDMGRPVFTLISINPVLTQFHTSRCPNPINLTEAGVVNFGGVITGYNAEREGMEYWEVMVRRHGYNNNMIKIKMDVSGKNFARVSNYAFSINDVTSD